LYIFRIEVNGIFAENRGDVGRDTMPSKRLSNEEFQEFLHSLFAKDTLKVKYQKPDSWRRHPSNTE
jgi:DNA-binding cell septation regulator SpoVG